MEKSQTQNLKGKCQLEVAKCSGGCGSIGGNPVKMGFADDMVDGLGKDAKIPKF